MAFRMTGERLWRKISKDESNILSMQASGVLIVLPGSKVVDPPHDYALIKSGTGRHVP